MHSRPSPSRQARRVTCPNCGLDQPLSMDCGGCGRAFSLEELNAAGDRPAEASKQAPQQAHSTPSPSPPPLSDGFGGFLGPDTGGSVAVAPSTPAPGASNRTGSPPGSSGPPGPRYPQQQTQDPQARDSVFLPLPVQEPEEDPEVTGDVYDPSTAVHTGKPRRLTGIRISAVGLVRGTLSAASDNFVAVFAVTFVVAAPAILYWLYLVGLAESLGEVAEPDVRRFGYHLIGVLGTTVACQLMGTAALTHVLGCWLEKKTVVLADSIGLAFRSLAVLIPLFIVQSVGIMFGYLLLILPGITLMIGWSLSVPVAVMERTGILQALGRSWQLTRGYKWSIFLAVFLLNLTEAVVTLGTAIAIGPDVYWPVKIAFSVALIALKAVMAALIYFKLR